MLSRSRTGMIIIGVVSPFLLILLAMLSCDRRRGIDSAAQQIADVEEVLVSLSPPQIFLPSPESIDSVEISIAVLNSDGVGLKNVKVSVTRGPAIGYVTQPESTNADGHTSARFVASPGQYGTVTITATAGSKAKSRPLYISGPSDYSMSLNYSPHVPKLIDHEGDPYGITATLVDTTQRGVAGQPVTFSILNRVGRISFADTVTVPRTNSEGSVVASFYNTQEDEINNPQFAQIQAVTTSPSDSVNPIVATVTVPLRPVQNTLSVAAIPPTIFGDPSDSTVIRTFLLDTYGNGIVGEMVSFNNPGKDGTPQPSAVTDSNGIARSTFRPFEDSIGVTQIVATYRVGSIHEASGSVDVDILPIRSIAFITVSLQKQNVIANGADSSVIFITVQDSTGGLIADGTSIYLEHTGSGSLSSLVEETINGQATSAILAPTNIQSGPRVDSIFVWGNSSDTTIVADTAVVTYIPDVIDGLQMIRPDSAVVLIAGSGMLDTIQVFAKDANGNPVANGTSIFFINQISSSTVSPSPAQTVEGIATAVYLVGAQTGDDNVMALVQNPGEPTDTIWSDRAAVFRCLSSDATVLVLSSSQPSIQVGGSSCQIIATLEDAFGNALSEGYGVAFEIKSANGDPFAPFDWPSFDTEGGGYHDTVETNIQGQAVVQIYSGIVSGPVTIEACTTADTLFVCDEKSLITISSGPPAYVEASRAPVGEATNPDYPERFVQVGAWVADIYANPVEYGTAVYFTLIPQNVAEVEGNSFTGGPRLPYHPDSADGWAYSRILYGCYGTFDTLQLVAHSGGEHGSVGDTTVPFALPAFTPGIFLAANPGNLRCGGPHPDSCAQSAITALLTDGGGCAIEHGIIIFSALVAGEIVGPVQDTTDEFGIAETIYEICGDEIPTPPDLIPRIETAVRATLFGYPDVEAEVDLVCTRPQ